MCVVLHVVMSYNGVEGVGGWVWGKWGRRGHVHVKALVWQGAGPGSSVGWGSCQLLSLFWSVWPPYSVRCGSMFGLPHGHLGLIVSGDVCLH